MLSWLNSVMRPLGVQLVRNRWLSEIQDTRWSMRATLSRIRSLSCKPQTVIDIGAAEGRWAQMAAEVFPESALLLIEPLDERRPVLDAFCGDHRNSVLVSAVAGAVDGSVPFNVSADLDGSGVYDATTGSSRVVPMVRLDTAVSHHNLPGPYLIKFDTHGYEQAILEGAAGLLEETVCIVMECYTFKVSPSAILFWEMCGVLDKAGFRVADVADPWPRTHDGLLWQLDLVWLRKDHPSFSHEQYQ